MEDRKKTNKKMIEPITETSADVPISITVDGVKYYYLYVDMDAEHSFEFRNSFRINGLGSVTELIDENENVVNVYRYTPFGESLYKEEGVFNPYQYTGRRYDEETGQYYYRARMYSPQQARFLSNDPMGMIDGPNMYAYVRNNPINVRDPSGRMSGFWYSRALINGGGGGRRSIDDGTPLSSDVGYVAQEFGFGRQLRSISDLVPSVPGASGLCVAIAATYALRIWPPKDHFDGNIAPADKQAHAYIGCKVGRFFLCTRSHVRLIAASKEFHDWLKEISPLHEGTGWNWQDISATMWGYDNRDRGGGWGWRSGWLGIPYPHWSSRDSCRDIAKDVPY